MNNPISHIFFDDDNPNFNIIGHLVEDLVRPLPLLEVNRREVKTRNKKYYELIIPNYNDRQFSEHFRMLRESAERFTHRLTNVIRNTELNQMAPLRKKFLFCLWVLSKQESFLATSDRFDLPASTGHKIFKQIIYAISSLLSQFVVWPDVTSYERTAAIFNNRTRGFPGIIGAIDGCHIPCKQPVGNEIDFYNRKESHSIVLQGTCDHQGKFIDVYIGSPGRMHDARVFRNSPLFGKLEERSFIPSNFHLLGDAAYPLKINLMTPFRNNGHLTQGQSVYNTRLSIARSIIERAFGHLKGKFRRLKYLDISNFELGNNMIAAACVLHNFIIDQNVDEIENIIMNETFENIIINEEITRPHLDQLAVQKRNNIVALFQ